MRPGKKTQFQIWDFVWRNIWNQLQKKGTTKTDSWEEISGRLGQMQIAQAKLLIYNHMVAYVGFL
jgi:hypothetical protein